MCNWKCVSKKGILILLTEIELASHVCYLNKSQHTDTGPTNFSTDPWQCGHMNATSPSPLPIHTDQFSTPLPHFLFPSEENTWKRVNSLAWHSQWASTRLATPEVNAFNKKTEGVVILLTGQLNITTYTSTHWLCTHSQISPALCGYSNHKLMLLQLPMK